MTKSQVIAALPAYSGKEILICEEQSVADIVREILDAHEYFAVDYTGVADMFYTGNVSTTAAKIFDFLKSNVEYRVESEEEQSTKSPSALLNDGHGDCKGYAGFAAGVLDAINRVFDAGIKWRYRFACYDGSGSPGHVFVVVWDDGGELWIDPVLSNLDERKQPTSYYDRGRRRRAVAGINDDLFRGAEFRGGVVGAFPWAAVAETAMSFVKEMFGDKVPNYPVKEPKTFESLKNSLKNDWVGTVAPGGVFEVVPTSIEQARQMLAAARKRQAEETAMGHGYGDGPGWDTLQMLYDETIAALEVFIDVGGKVMDGSIPVTQGTPSVPTGAGVQKAGVSAGILLAALAAGAIFLKPKKGSVSGINSNMLLIGGGIALAIFLLRSKRVPEDLPIEEPQPAEEVEVALTEGKDATSVYEWERSEEKPVYEPGVPVDVANETFEQSLEKMIEYI